MYIFLFLKVLRVKMNPSLTVIREDIVLIESRIPKGNSIESPMSIMRSWLLAEKSVTFLPMC